MVRRVRIWHSKDGYALHVVDAPAWAYALDAVNETLIGTVCKASKGYLCPLCLCNHWDWTFRVGWGRDEDGLRRHSLGGLLFGLGQRGGRFHLNREREVYRHPLTFDEVCEHFPESRVEWDDDGETCVRGEMLGFWSTADMRATTTVTGEAQ